MFEFATIVDLVDAGLWPNSKKIIGEPELVSLGYYMFYEGKNADLYFKPGDAAILMVRSDRTSVFDILLSDRIEGKGEIQNRISNFGYDYAESLGIQTARLDMPSDIPHEIECKSQYIRLEKPLSITLKEKEVGLELIFRNYLTGSLFKEYQAGNDPYGLFLVKDLDEWQKFDAPIFTPTTKGVSDEPIIHTIVLDRHTEKVFDLRRLFIDFTDYAYKRGIVVVDTKFEMFGDMLGDEILTPESSRFILRENFEKGDYQSMDKQILRNYAKQQGWDKKGNKGQLLYVEIPDSIKEQILQGYQKVYDMLSA